VNSPVIVTVTFCCPCCPLSGLTASSLGGPIPTVKPLLNVSDRALAVLERDARPIRSLRPDLPESLAAVIDDALREEEGQPLKYRSAAAFKETAEKAKDGCPISNALKGNVAFELDAQLEG